ncbi:hypothetical protein [Leptodesmis sp.]|uniref:hypothetical protein n=1 Tax=Leptodesmis sp. TaxID=3100501 RepID=UPI004053490D
MAHASYFNTLAAVVPNPGDPPVPLDGSRGLGPYHFKLQAIVAIAPTEGQYRPVNGPVVFQDNYFIMHGSSDGDVWTFEGYQTYDRRAQPIDLSAPTRTAKGTIHNNWQPSRARKFAFVAGERRNSFLQEFGFRKQPIVP